MNELAFFINNVLVAGVVLGCIYALGAVGVTLIFGILRFAHFAHGDMMTMGGFVTFVLAGLATAMGIQLGWPTGFIVLPLAYWSMAPGIELDGRMSWVPITNALLLQQRLMAVRPDPFPWQHVPAVVLSLTACVGVALVAAVWQFKRESVLFREAQAGGRRWSLFGRAE